MLYVETLNTKNYKYLETLESLRFNGQTIKDIGMDKTYAIWNCKSIMFFFNNFGGPQK